jgi:Tfp pilus assembly protein PilO
MKLKSREKILFIFAVIAIAIFVFDQFYYGPQNRKISKFKEEIEAADQKMDQFLQLTKGVQTVEAEVTRLEKELKVLSERTLKGEEFRAFLRHLAKESDPLQMKIISLTPQEEKPPLLEGKKESTTLRYRKVTIQMVLHSTYTKLWTYLNEIEQLPFFVNIDSLQIERNEEMQSFLKVTMGLSMHITDELERFKRSRGRGPI